MPKLDSCWVGENYHFLMCGDPDKCKRENERLEVCTLENYERLDKEDQNLLMYDALNDGLYRIADLRDHLDTLNNVSKNIKIGDGNENLEKMRKKHGNITPLKVDNKKYELEEREYHVRASEFSNTCPVARLISKFDGDKLEKGLDMENIEVDERYAKAGTALHEVSQGDMGQDHIEVPVWLDHEGYIISGHIDAAYVTEKDSIPVIIDLKRTIKPPKSYDDQAFYYLAALNQRLGLNAEYGLSDLIAHASFDKTMKNPRHHLTLMYLPGADEDNMDEESRRRIDELLRNLDKNVEAQREILHGGKFQKVRKSSCESCFPSIKTVCDFLEGKDPEEFMDERVVL